MHERDCIVHHRFERSWLYEEERGHYHGDNWLLDRQHLRAISVPAAGKAYISGELSAPTSERRNVTDKADIVCID